MHRLSPFGPEVPCLFILMERANGGNLEELINVQWTPRDEVRVGYQRVAERRRAKEVERLKALRECAMREGGIACDERGVKVRYLRSEEIVGLFLDVCRGLDHLHRNGIIHRDLKPPNLLLRYSSLRTADEIPSVLISDFGECEVLTTGTDLVASRRTRTGGTGTMEFMPPELLMTNASGQLIEDYSTSADLWSLGMVLYYLCYSCLPYTQIDDVDILRQEILEYQCLRVYNIN
ncbi:putative serine/threonine-protein kinase iks1 [Nowakowskiella sp. JEL0078]|nr:putative serine/threonine-protein kinase iks1 [Nowakowskiella sp. JEL0078]